MYCRIGARFGILAIATGLLGTGIVPVALPPVAAQQTEPGAKEATASDARVPLSVIGAIPNTQQVRISPEGNRLAMTMNLNGEEIYTVLDLTEDNPKPKIFASAGEFRDAGDRTVGFYRWIGNDHIVFQLLSRENIFGTRGDIGRLVSYDVKTGKTEPLVWRDSGFNASRILYIDHDSGKFLLERTNRGYESGADQRRPEVVRVDVASGKFERVQRPNLVVEQWFADGNGTVRMGTSYDGDTGKARTLYRSSEGDTFHTIQEVVDESFSGKGVNPEIFLDEPDMAIVTSNKDGFNKIYKANLATMKLEKELFSVDGYDVGGVVPNQEHNQAIGYTYTTDGSKISYTDPILRTIKEQVLDPSFGPNNAEIVSSNEVNTRLVLKIGNNRQLGGFYLYDTETGAFNTIGWTNSQLQDTELNSVSAVRYMASDGEEIEAIVTMPRHRKGETNLPVMMITHGGPFGPRDSTDYDGFGWNQAMAELGYVVIQPNYRGSGGYGADWIKKGRDDGFGLRMQDDLNDAIDALARKGIVDPDRACMMGWSYGGYAAARAAQRDADRWKCTIAGAGVYDLALMKKYDVGYLGKFGSNYLAKGAADLDQVSPAEHPEGHWAPIAIVHGKRDQRVPIEQAETLVKALKGAGKIEGRDFVYLEQPMNTHHLPYTNTRVEWLGTAAAWAAKWNPAYIPSDADYADRPEKLDSAAIKMAKRLSISGI